MARIIYGPIITDIKGSIGGMTFQKNGSGTIARLKPRKTKTNTQKQRDQQPRLKQVQAAWNLLTLINKVLWNDFAAINNKIGLDGQEKKLTGYQWFLTINENRLLISQPILSAPPIYEIVNPILGIYLSWNQNILDASYNETFPGDKYGLLFYASFVLNSASKFDFNKTRLVRKAPIATDGTRAFLRVSDPTWWIPYYNETFPPNLGTKSFYLAVYIRFISKSSGISSLAYTTISKFVWDGTKYVIE